MRDTERHQETERDRETDRERLRETKRLRETERQTERLTKRLRERIRVDCRCVFRLPSLPLDHNTSFYKKGDGNARVGGSKVNTMKKKYLYCLQH